MHGLIMFSMSTLNRKSTIYVFLRFLRPSFIPSRAVGWPFLFWCEAKNFYFQSAPQKISGFFSLVGRKLSSWVQDVLKKKKKTMAENCTPDSRWDDSSCSIPKKWMNLQLVISNSFTTVDDNKILQLILQRE